METKIIAELGPAGAVLSTNQFVCFQHDQPGAPALVIQSDDLERAAVLYAQNQMDGDLEQSMVVAVHGSCGQQSMLVRRGYTVTLLMDEPVGPADPDAENGDADVDPDESLPPAVSPPFPVDWSDETEI